MKSVLLYTLSLVLCLLFLGFMPLSGEEEIYDDVIRLHILADSDSAEDQRLKLCVRDAILANYSSALAGGTKAEAAQKVECLLPQIKQLAESTLEKEGKASEVTVTFTEEEYPTRAYGELSFPAGTYMSLRVHIGSGAGQNWWCVLFPPLCLGSATGDAVLPSPSAPPDGVSPGAWRLVSQSGEYQIRFRVLEWLAGH